MKRIVILGAGFGGLRVAISLSSQLQKDEAQVILVDRNSYQTYTPALYEIAAAYRGGCLVATHADEGAFRSELGGSVAFDISDVLKNTDVTVLKDEILSIDGRVSRVVLREGGPISFDYLVIALGSRTAFYGVEGAQEHCATVKSIEDALNLRTRVERALRSTRDGEELTVAVVGGGLTGFEVITEIALYLSHLKHQARKERVRARLVLIEASSTILGGAPVPMRARALERLSDLGITVMTNAPVARVEKDMLFFASGGFLKTDVQMWSGGVEAHDVVKSAEGVLVNEHGQVIVNEFLTSKTRHTIFAIGDACEYIDVGLRMKAPATAWAAEQQAAVAADNIIALLRGKHPQACALTFPGFVAAAGGRYAIAHLFGITVCGWPAWLVKRAIDLKYLSSLYAPLVAMRIWVSNTALFSRND